MSENPLRNESSIGFSETTYFGNTKPEFGLAVALSGFAIVVLLAAVHFCRLRPADDLSLDGNEMMAAEMGSFLVDCFLYVLIAFSGITLGWVSIALGSRTGKALFVLSCIFVLFAVGRFVFVYVL